MAKKIEIIDKAIVITDTVTTDVVNEFPQGDVFFDSKKLAVGIVQFYDTSGTNPTGSVLFKEDLAGCVDSTLTPFTEATFRDFCRVSLGFNPAASGGGVTSVNGDTGPAVTIDKTTVGLGNVDNTSDANKPLSSATVTALSGKKDDFSENTAFNKDFGTSQGNVMEGNTTTITGTQASDITANNAKVSFPEAPNDGNQYARKDLGWEQVTQLVSCCPFGAKSDGTGNFLIANGKSSDADDSSKDKTRQPIPYDGTLIGLAYKTKEADSTTTMKIHVNGVVEQTVILTNINANEGGIEALSVAVIAGDHVEIEYDANQKPGECTMSLNLETS